MNNYSVTFSILGYYFIIITHKKQLLDEQVRHIKKFCITDPTKETIPRNADITTLKYIEDSELFQTVRKKFDNYKTEIVKSFEGIFHLKFIEGRREYFCQ